VFGINGFLDRSNFSVRDRAANKGDVLHAGQANVGDILPSAAQKAIVLFTQN
jgi:hypothetical protein